MKKLVGALSALVITAAMGVSLAAAGYCAPEAGAQVAAGSKAPAVKLKDSHDKQVSLDDYKGKIVVLEWVNFDCPFVKKHYDSGNMQKLQKTYTGKGVVWLSINSSAPGRQGNYDGKKINELLTEKKATPTAYLFDPTGEVGKAYGAKTTPHMFVIDKQGSVIYAGAIDDHPGVDATEISASKNYVQQALDEALAGKQVTTAATKSYGCSVKYQ